MNFGKWIVVAFVLFAGFIGALVTVCVRQDISLVSKEYYKDELSYPEQLTRMSNAQALTEKPVIKKRNKNELEISFPQPVEKGEIKLFCPSDARMDRRFEIKLSDNRQLLDVNSLKPGMYRIKLSWSAKGEDYFLEDIMYL